MNFKSILTGLVFLFFEACAIAQVFPSKNEYTRADTLRGTITTYRQGWDVLRYDLTVHPNIENKSISGSNRITYNEILPVKTMQIDLQSPMQIDSVVTENGGKVSFKKTEGTWLLALKPEGAMIKFLPGTRSLVVYFSGTPKEAKKAPWDGGLVWSKDEMGNPFIATACQGLGASVWWPCKDHQSDEPDNGMTIKLVAPRGLVALSNGRLLQQKDTLTNSSAWTWEVKNPINNYDVTMNIGSYVNWTDTLMGEGGKLDLSYWVLDYNIDKAKKQFAQVKPMLRSFEHWFGKYPFYEDGYKLIETPFLGMEHQSAVAYGNAYKNGYLGRDLSGTGWGLKWDFIIIHESGHEWFGNNITTNDIADMWVHEGFTNYSETLYTESQFGRQAANEYSYGIRKNIKNDKPITGDYGVNKEGSGDMYYKASNMIHSIRNAIDNEALFRNILRGLNATFYHKTVDASMVESFISKQSGIDLSRVFDQYLRTIQVPVLEFYSDKNRRKIFYRYTNCVQGFNLPLVLKNNNASMKVYPTEKWQKVKLKDGQQDLWQADEIEKNYYLTVKKAQGKNR